mgnify:CR=1 FL=1
MNHDQMSPDPMMDELRAARCEVATSILALDPSERCGWIVEESDKILSEAGYQLVAHPTRKNFSRIVKAR